MSRTDARTRIVIVGAGRAGLAAAERLRQCRFTGELVIIGDEVHRPYNRTPLSKQLLTGRYQPADLRLPSAVDLDAIWRLGTRVHALDPHTQTLTLPGGEHLEYDGLVIATGVQARHLPGTPMHSPRVHMLRTFDDARRIDADLATAGHLAVIGGGFIGCEIAATARARAVRVTVIDVSATLLGHSLGPALGATVGDLHRAAGVRLHLGVAVRDWQPTDRGVTITLDDGERITADTAVVGVGTTAHTEWLRGSGLNHGNGVLCAPTCHAVDPTGQPIAGIVAAGDIARWPNLRFDTTPRRIEHFINAVEMGQHAADSLLAGPARATPFTPVPRFWSEQHGVRIQSAGMPALGTTMTITEGDLPSHRFLATYTTPDHTGQQILTGAIAFNAPRTLIRHHNLIGHPAALARSGA